LPAETQTDETDAAEDDERQNDEDEQRSEPKRKEAQSKGEPPQQPQRDRGDVLSAVLKGAAVGSAAGAALGAWAAFARVMWPEQIEEAGKAVTGTVRDVGRSAAAAAGQTLDPAAIAGLLPGNDDRAEVVKRSARDAATAAAKAARDTISSMSDGTSNGSKGA
jgi:hypothetical protein